MKKRKGFTMIEMIASTALLTLIVIGVMSSSLMIESLETQTKNTVYLSVHNLNCMERLRKECTESDSGLLSYYGDDYLGTIDIETVAYLERATWDHFNIYRVKIQSNVRETSQVLTSEYVITDIGSVNFDPVIN